ncbi:hypothetical protein [Mariniblastus fucicola]|uniref:DUF4149 domain-containing protein n=1 Tax=Mariniblastus fucicola TaxID=980251 RepID=A0A5B9P8G2_9BACT|nr:hypothetical protein [Mariniblastus fucicola]QEG23007.1 hypothetical protein MFFC18_28990 [Mariniblastus fucicola]
MHQPNIENPNLDSSASSRFATAFHVLFQTLLVAAFAMWFGGFGFYVSFVVPVGNEVLGSTFEQGLITREVTVPLNWLGLFAGLLMLCDVILMRFSGQSPGRRMPLLAVGAMAIVILVMQVALFWLHPQIDAFVDLEIHEIKDDYDQFYWLHRLYLWASTIQWIAAWVWLLFRVSLWRTARRLSK